MTLAESEVRYATRVRATGAALVAGGAALVVLAQPDWPGYAVAGLGALVVLVAPLLASLAEGWRR